MDYLKTCSVLQFEYLSGDSRRTSKTVRPNNNAPFSTWRLVIISFLSDSTVAAPRKIWNKIVIRIDHKEKFMVLLYLNWFRYLKKNTKKIRLKIKAPNLWKKWITTWWIETISLSISNRWLFTKFSIESLKKGNNVPPIVGKSGIARPDEVCLTKAPRISCKYIINPIISALL